MIDKQLVSRRFARAVETYNHEASAQRQIACNMARMLKQYLPLHCRRVLEIGCGTGFFTRCLIEALRPEQLTLNDLCPEMSACLAPLLDSGQATFLAGDAETLSFPSGQDLIALCSVLQWFLSPERFFTRCHSLLAPEGHLAFTTFGPDNLKEVTAVTGTALDYRSVVQLKHALASRYDIVAATEERITLHFATPLQVLYHLKHTGVAALKQQAWTRRDMQTFCDRYAALSGTFEGVTLTYHPIYIIAKKKPLAGNILATGHTPNDNQTMKS